MKKILLSLAVMAGLGLSACAPITQVTPPQPTVIPDKDLRWIADKVYKNETSGNPALLVVWNDREDFASLGIGHFIWYPEGRRGPYTETFPGLIDYAKEHAVPLPAWLQNRTLRGTPWPNKAAFQRAQNDQEMHQLRNFLLQTMNMQANYMSQRLTRAMPMLVNAVPPQDRDRVLRNYQAVEKSPRGLYPLLDYINFKGEGTSPTERYNGQGWGLLQVLQAMSPVEPGPQALSEFARAAEEVLVRRSGIEWEEGKLPATLYEVRSLSERLYKDQGINVQNLMGHKDPRSTALYDDERKEHLTMVLDIDPIK